jgi:hypothetical protein
MSFPLTSVFPTMGQLDSQRFKAVRHGPGLDAAPTRHSRSASRNRSCSSPAVTQRERWQALQAHLSTARAFMEAGDQQRALAEVNAALALDPDFLAAQSLRDRLVKKPAAHASVPKKPTGASLAATAPAAFVPGRQPIRTAPEASAASAFKATQSVGSPSAAQSVPKAATAPWTTPSVGALTRDSAVSSGAVATPTPKATSPAKFADALAVTAAAAAAAQPISPPPVGTSLTEPAARPRASAEDFAHFEARAKRRRVDRRIEAARAAIGRGKLHEAASVIDEIITLDPNLPELTVLTAEFDELRKSTDVPRRGPWLMAAAVFAVVVLGASWLHESGALVSYPVKVDVALVAPPGRALMEPVFPEPPVGVATAGVTEPVADTAVPDLTATAPAPARTPDLTATAPAPARRVRADALPAVSRAVRPAEPEPIVPAVPPLPPPSASAVTTAALSEPLRPMAAAAPPPPTAPLPTPPPPPVSRTAMPAALPASAPAPDVTPPGPDEEGRVKQALQRYRHAYEGLDAQSAHDVWPAVDQASLARAFEGLASQTITFDECDVSVHGGIASATCRGTTRYVPKIGSREPRVEPRIWNFALKKDGADWKIDSARADR